MMTDYTCRWDLSDVVFKVQARRVYASRTILSMWSPVLKAMFHDDFKEKNAEEIELPGKNFEDILEMVKVLHPPNKELDETNVGLILPLAREYQMDELIQRCEKFLVHRPPSVQSLVLAEEYTLNELRIQCMDYIKTQRLYDLCEEPEFELLASDTKVMICREKAMKYEEKLHGVKAVVSGHRPQQKRFRTGGTLCTFSCSDREHQDNKLPHNSGTDRECKSCALHMVKKIDEIMEDLYQTDSD